MVPLYIEWQNTLARQIDVSADESAVLDDDATGVNVADESRAVADVDCFGPLDAALQRAKYVDPPGLDARAHVPVGRDREEVAGHVNAALYLTLYDERFVAVDFTRDRDGIGENRLGCGYFYAERSGCRHIVRASLGPGSSTALTGY